MSDGETTELHMEGNTTETVEKSAEPKENGQGVVAIQYGEMLVNLQKEKRTRKTKLTKVKHRLQKLFRTRAEREEIKSCIEEIWELLEEAQSVMDDMSVLALKMGNTQLQLEIMKESDGLQEETQQVIKKAEEDLIDLMLATEKVTESVTGSPSIAVSLSPITQPTSVGQVHQNITTPSTSPQQAPQPTNAEQMQQDAPNTPIASEQVPHLDNLGQLSPSINNPTAPTITYPGERLPSSTGGTINRSLKALRVPKFDGNKATFEEFWCLFDSLVDKSSEPVNIKMARFRECLSGRALEAIRGLGVSEAEYKEAKEIIQSKFGGERRQLRAYMEELEKTQPLRNNDVSSFDRFTDLVRVTVAKLKAEGREAELGEGSLHGQLVKKLSSQQVESYSRWLNVHSKTPSVTNLCDWLKKEVAIKMEAAEMAHGLEQKPLGDPPFKRASGLKPRTFFSEVDKKSNQQRPPCQFCGQNSHPIWYCKKYEALVVDQRWKTAKEKALCFRCLSKDHHRKDCRRTGRCGVDGCSLSHHHLLHDPERQKKNGAYVSHPPRKEAAPPKSSDAPREGANAENGSENPGEGAHTNVTTTMNTKSSVEAYSLRTVPVWVKANGRKMKVNAVLDDASNETFMNEELAGALGLKPPKRM